MMNFSKTKWIRESKHSFIVQRIKQSFLFDTYLSFQVNFDNRDLVSSRNFKIKMEEVFY